MQETWVRSLGQEDPLEEERATPFNTLAWEIPWTEEPGGLWSEGLKIVGQDWVYTCACIHVYTHTHVYMYFCHLMWRASSLEKILMLGKNEGKRRRGQQKMRWLDGITDSMEIVEEREAWCAAVHGVAKSWTWLSNWMTICVNPNLPIPPTPPPAQLIFLHLWGGKD